ncbi:hypothetical protein [Roseibium alexandrii]|uniref:Uncharacterized protein n=1 Tax=Roseibium alexandrii (strain DSM 17067 / NCIMB 14079 / DFL-11) TaxID=244592 RepID=A0A5E8GVP1_ROSAD|nr:hypothetical protein [Roseibium alexandrii]EEE43623.2 hypothetical protein SADFL11_909 [Roseibium alexandrii DFL-11]
MNGELLHVWPQTWVEIWSKLKKARNAPKDLYIELIRQLVPAPIEPEVPAAPPAAAFNENGELIDPEYLRIRDAYHQSHAEFDQRRMSRENALSGDDTQAYFKNALTSVTTEEDAVAFLEKAYGTLETFDEEAELKAKFRELVLDFLSKFSLRYELRDEFSLNPTIAGVFVKMLAEVKRLTAGDDHINELLAEFDDAFADLKIARTPARMKTCLQKQYNLLEAIGATYPGVEAETLGAMCDQLDWPHATIKEVGKKLYGFGSNYPGLRHGGRRRAALRPLDMKDFVSISLMLAAFTPYVIAELEPDRCYTG